MRNVLFGALALAALLAAARAGAQVTLYENDGFRGRAFAVDRDIANFGNVGFNDRASSAIVDRGQWEVCENAGFAGRCSVLAPGQYPSLGALGLNNRISSIRRVKGRHRSPPPPPSPQYSYYPRHGERLYTANVVAVRAVVGPPEQRCWVERQQVTTPGGPNVAGAVIGGILGGVIGHQIGNGRGNDVATAVGAVGGAAVGANVNRGAQTTTQDVRHCQAVPGSATVAYWDVTYVFRGIYHRAQLAFEPGPTIPVNGKGEPRV
jgi:uncharacterized protein YcfJ